MDVYEEGVRSGYEGARVGFGGFGIDAYKKGQKVDPKVQAAYNLNKTLEKYPEFTKDARTQIQNEFVRFSDIAFVNLETFASVLNFLKLYPNPTPLDFRDEIIVEYFSRLLSDKPLPAEEKLRIILRLKAQFLKYIFAIKVFRMREEEEGQGQTIREAQQPADEEEQQAPDEEETPDAYREEEYEVDD